MYNRILLITTLLFIGSSFALQCGKNTCGATDACCNDEILGYTCYDPSRAKCLSTHLPSSSSSGAGSKLCGVNDATCNATCYDPTSYYCCNYRQLKQKGQSCPPAGTLSPTSASTQQAHTTISPTTAPTSAPKPQNNCPGAANSAGVNCSNPNLCCGAGTMTPSCLPADGSKECCTWFLSSTQCNPGQTCGGDYGYGASSYATCGPSGSVFCNQGDGDNTFCSPTDLCCGNYGQYAFCCPGNNSTCPTDYSFNCVYSSATAAPTQAKTTVAPTTAPTSAPKPLNNCPGAAGTAGVNCSNPNLCCGSGTMTPTCLPADGSKKCCTWYLSSTQCNPDQVCGGDLGYGASSYATCGAPGTVFCNQGDAENTYCKPTDLCCGNYGQIAFCCPGNNSTCPTDSSFNCVYSSKSQ